MRTTHESTTKRHKFVSAAFMGVWIFRMYLLHAKVSSKVVCEDVV
jgi:hypothetical protein